MRRWVVVAAIAAASSAVAVAAVAASWGAEMEPYAARGAFVLSYGASDASPGRAEGGGEAVAPTSISVDASGDIVMADPAKRRIAVFDRSGSYVTSLPVGAVPVDAVPDGAGTAVLTASRQLMLFDGVGQRQLCERVASEVASDGVKGLALGRSCVWVETGRGESFRLAVVGKGPKGVPEDAQPGSRVRGALRGSAAFECFYEQGGRVVRHPAEGPDLVVSLEQQDLQGVSVAGADGSEAFYVICEIGTDAGCRTECRKYSPQGRLLARFDVVADRSWTTRSTAVSPDGTVYRLVCDQTCVRVTAYSTGGAS